MEDTEYQDLLRLLFLKMANESGRKIKIPKSITHSSFNVFFESVCIKDIRIINHLLNQSVNIRTETRIQKPLSQLVKHYGYWDGKTRPFFRIEDDCKDFISIKFNPNPESSYVDVFFYNERFKQICKAAISSDVNYFREDIFPQYMGIDKTEEGYILKVKKERIDDIFVRVNDSNSVQISIDSMLSENLLEMIAPNGY